MPISAIPALVDAIAGNVWLLRRLAGVAAMSLLAAVLIGGQAIPAAAQDGTTNKIVTPEVRAAAEQWVLGVNAAEADVKRATKKLQKAMRNGNWGSAVERAEVLGRELGRLESALTTGDHGSCWSRYTTGSVSSLRRARSGVASVREDAEIMRSYKQTPKQVRSPFTPSVYPQADLSLTLWWFSPDRAGQHDADRLLAAFCVPFPTEAVETPDFEVVSVDGAIGFGKPVTLQSGNFVALAINDGQRDLGYQLDAVRKSGKKIKGRHDFESSHLAGQVQVIYELMGSGGALPSSARLDASDKRQRYRGGLIERDLWLGTPSVYTAAFSAAAIPWRNDGAVPASYLVQAVGLRDGLPTGHGRVNIYTSPGQSGVALAPYLPGPGILPNDAAYAVVDFIGPVRSRAYAKERVTDAGKAAPEGSRWVCMDRISDPGARPRYETRKQVVELIGDGYALEDWGDTPMASRFCRPFSPEEQDALEDDWSKAGDRLEGSMAEGGWFGCGAPSNDAGKGWVLWADPGEPEEAASAECFVPGDER